MPLPIGTGSIQSLQRGQLPTRSTLLQKFVKASRLGHVEAKYYLEEAEWDMNTALGMWRDDRDWEEVQVGRRPIHVEDL